MVDTFNRLSDPFRESVSRHDTYRISLLPLSVPLCHSRGEHAHSQESYSTVDCVSDLTSNGSCHVGLLPFHQESL